MTKKIRGGETGNDARASRGPGQGAYPPVGPPSPGTPRPPPPLDPAPWVHPPLTRGPPAGARAAAPRRRPRPAPPPNVYIPKYIRSEGPWPGEDGDPRPWSMATVGAAKGGWSRGWRWCMAMVGGRRGVGVHGARWPRVGVWVWVGAMAGLSMALGSTYPWRPTSMNLGPGPRTPYASPPTHGPAAAMDLSHPYSHPQGPSPVAVHRGRAPGPPIRVYRTPGP